MHVGITEKLKYVVQDNIQKMCLKEVGGLTRPPNLTEADVEMAVWGSYLDLRDRMPPNWMRVYDDLRIKFECCTEDVPVEQYRVPPAWGRYSYSVEIPDNPSVAAWGEYFKHKAEAIKRWDHIKNEVRAFLNKCKSLNEALKLFPEIAVYIPDELVQKTKEKLGPRTKEDNAAKIEGVDRESIITGAVIARISEGL